MSQQKIRIWWVVILLAVSVPVSNGIRFTKENTGLIKNVPISSSTFDFDAVYADILWVRTIQYVSTREMTRGPGLLSEKDAHEYYSMFDRITDLNPKAYLVYKYAGLMLGVEAPDLATAIIDKGMKNIPDAGWELPFYAAVIAYHTIQNYEMASKYLKEAAIYTDHPSYIDRLLAMSFVKKGDLKIAFDMWSVIYEKAQSSYEKNISSQHLFRLAKRIIEEGTDNALKRKAEEIINLNASH